MLLKNRELQDKKLIFLHNLNAIGFFYCIMSSSVFLTTTCTRHTGLFCAIQSVIFVYGSTLSGYGLSALAIFRLSCVLFYDLENKLTIMNLTFSLIAIWLTPLILNILQVVAFKTDFYFVQNIYICLHRDLSSNNYSFVYFVCINAVIPNVLVIASYILTLRKIRRLRFSKNTMRPIQAQNITLQLFIYIFVYELQCIANIIYYKQSVMMIQVVSDEILAFLKIVKFLHHLSPLGLIYFHPTMVRKLNRNANKKPESVKLKVLSNEN